MSERELKWATYLTAVVLASYLVSTMFYLLRPDGVPEWFFELNNIYFWGITFLIVAAVGAGLMAWLLSKRVEVEYVEGENLYIVYGEYETDDGKTKFARLFKTEREAEEFYDTFDKPYIHDFSITVDEWTGSKIQRWGVNLKTGISLSANPAPGVTY